MLLRVLPEGCICPSRHPERDGVPGGPTYMISFGVSPSSFCAGGPRCLRALLRASARSGVQDLVLVKPVKVPERWTAAAAGCPMSPRARDPVRRLGLHVSLGGWEVNIGRRFVICEWDRSSASSALGRSTCVMARLHRRRMFVGRPYCRLLPVWRHPRPALPGVEERLVTPNQEVDCGCGQCLRSATRISG